MMQVRVVAIVALILAQEATGQEITRAPGGKSFFENFATFDRKRWVASNGWASGDFQDCLYLGGNALVAGRTLQLRLTNRRNARSSYTCAEVRSVEAFGHGMYEVRMRAPDPSPGTVSSFFTFVRPPHDEITIEFVGKNPKEIQTNYFVNGVSQRGKSFDLDFDTTASMNDYAFEWLPDTLRWFVNGHLIHEVKREADKPYPVTPGNIFVSVWNGKGSGSEAWLGHFVYPGRPLVARYEHIAFTAQGQPCQFPTSIVCSRLNGAKPQ
jgi:endo-1,3-1,4-beta-glycanase ExoK